MTFNQKNSFQCLLFTWVVLFLSASPALSKKSEELCQQLAGDLWATDARGLGLEIDDINAGLALGACQQAYAETPDAANHYRLARVLKNTGRIKEAIPLLKQSSSMNYGPSQFLLGRLYFFGQDITADRNKGIKLLQKAAKNGHVRAHYELGNIYLYGHCVRMNTFMAFDYFQSAAKLGHIPSQAKLGYMFFYIGAGWAENEENGAKWLTMAAKAGHAASQYNLAILYLSGRGVLLDEEMGRYWLSQAAKQGYKPAKDLLLRR